MRPLKLDRMLDPGRPLLVAMVNPLSVDPAKALWPFPAGCAGHRLWRMLWARTGASREDYLWAFERVNMVQGSCEWSPVLARASLPWLRLKAEGRLVVCFGAAVADLWGLAHEALRWQGDAAYVPYPSTRTRWYGDLISKYATEIFMEELYCGTSYVQSGRGMVDPP